MKVDTGRVEFLVERDDMIFRIFGKFERGVRKNHECLGPVQYVLAGNGAEDNFIIKEAKVMID